MRAYERLIQYTAFPSASNPENAACPSTPEQLAFGRALVDEMRALGIQDARIDAHGYVYGTIEANIENWNGTTIGFIAHMDVTVDAPSLDIRPRIVENYDGGDIILSENIVLSPNEYETLKDYTGKSLVVTDGKTLLGADDKAGVAEIMTMVEELNNNPAIKHGRICIAFTPDEEIGRGADLFDVAGFGADYAYTVDGAAFGEVEYESFNATAGTVTVTGKGIHPGEAKDKMLNAQLVAMEFESLMPEKQKPQYTAGYEGFIHLVNMRGTVEETVMHYILRDHDAEKLKEKEGLFLAAAQTLNKKYGENTVQAKVKESYRNMAEIIKEHWHLIETAQQAILTLGGKPVCKPIRGGTDGSRLSFMGLPCPNLGNGSHNHHGRKEYAVIEDMDKCVQLLIEIAKLYA